MIPESFDIASKPIFITGYMASGKTTFGRALAKALGRHFIDLDFYIEQRFRKSISQIFDSEGEVSFRDKETKMLLETGDFENVVIACGGGTPCFNSNMDEMLARGLVIYLDTTVERIVERLEANRSRRPLMAFKTTAQLHKAVAEGLASRIPYYMKAHIKFSGENLEDRRQISESVYNFINRYLEK